jgi:hypothetical protein
MDQFQLVNLHRAISPNANSVDLESLKKKVKHIKTKKVHHKKKHGKKSHKKSKKSKKTHTTLHAKAARHGAAKKSVKQDVVIQRPLWEDFFGHNAHSHFGMGMPVHEELAHAGYGDAFYGHGYDGHFGDFYGHGYEPEYLGESAWGAHALADDFAGAYDYGYNGEYAPYAYGAAAALYDEPHYGGAYYGLNEGDNFGDYLADVHDEPEDVFDYDNAYGYGLGGHYGDDYYGGDYGYGLW